jgi:hypothetical protein
MRKIGSDCFTLAGMTNSAGLGRQAEWRETFTACLVPLSRRLHVKVRNMQKHLKQQAPRKCDAGRYTLDAAAELLSQNRGGRKGQIAQKLQQAACDDDLPVYAPGENLRYTNADRLKARERQIADPTGLYSRGITWTDTYDPNLVNVRYEEAYWDDLNAWLDTNETRITFRFAKPVESKVQCETCAARRENHDITKERGSRRLILEHWDDIEKLHGPNADARQVWNLVLKRIDASDKKPTLKTIQNHISALRKQGLLRPTEN